MAGDECRPVTVSRRICAPAHEIFQILTNPLRHSELDGSGMLRGAASTTPISGVGDVFIMKMYYSELGAYEMNNHVVEYEQDRRIGWEPESGRGHPDAAAHSSAQTRWGHRWSYELTPDGSDATIVTEIYDCSRAPADERSGMDNGSIWIESMTKTLERLDRLCVTPLSRWRLRMFFPAGSGKSSDSVRHSIWSPHCQERNAPSPRSSTRSPSGFMKNAPAGSDWRTRSPIRSDRGAFSSFRPLPSRYGSSSMP